MARCACGRRDYFTWARFFSMGRWICSQAVAATWIHDTRSGEDPGPVPSQNIVTAKHNLSPVRNYSMNVTLVKIPSGSYYKQIIASYRNERSQCCVFGGANVVPCLMLKGTSDLRLTRYQSTVREYFTPVQQIYVDKHGHFLPLLHATEENFVFPTQIT